jgi:hypothetical protein
LGLTTNMLTLPLQIWSRRFNTAGKVRMLPMLDLANTWNRCPHYLSFEPCQATAAFMQWAERLSASHLERASQTTGSECYASAEVCNATWPSKCFVWRAGAPLKAGEQACCEYAHGLLLQDMALLQYGFLQVSLTAAVPLFSTYNCTQLHKNQY